MRYVDADQEDTRSSLISIILLSGNSVPYEAHKREIGIADRSYKDKIGIVDIAAGEYDSTFGPEVAKDQQSRPRFPY
jgi:hypothetical protein